MADETGWQLKDYKIFCFHGEPKFIEVDYDRYVGHKLNVYDLDWNFIDFYMTSPMIEMSKLPAQNVLMTCWSWRESCQRTICSFVLTFILLAINYISVS